MLKQTNMQTVQTVQPVKVAKSEYYRIGDNLHGPFSHPINTLEEARKQREIFVSEAIGRLEGSSLSPKDARSLAKDWYWVCDDNEEIVD